jgi:membrane associated rhomboid family serine protease
MRPLTERLSPLIRNLVVAQTVVFVLFIMATPLREWMKSNLALGPLRGVGKLWQPFTALFIHLDPWNFLFDMIGLWFVGATIEKSMGRLRFLLLFFGCGLASNLVGGLLMFLLDYPSLFSGCGDSILALFIAFAVLYGRSQVRVFGQLVLQARVLTAILVGISLMVALIHAAWPSLAATLVAVILGYFISGGRWKDVSDFVTRLRRGKKTGFQILDGGRARSGKKYMN